MQLATPDSDNDGIADYLDLDSDNDGLPDTWESVGQFYDANGDGYIDDDTDVNGDGLADNINVNATVDTDEDNLNNHLDIDSDNDGASDLTEAGGSDANNDGVVDGWTDSDDDGIVDTVDVDFTGGEDADGDGIDDFADVDFVALADTDGDGIVDLFDDDLYGLGFLNIHDGSDSGATIAELPDSNSNGVPDVVEPRILSALDGTIYTGTAGAGCSISPRKNGGLDPLFALLLSAGTGMLLYRRSRR